MRKEVRKVNIQIQKNKDQTSKEGRREVRKGSWKERGRIEEKKQSKNKREVTTNKKEEERRKKGGKKNWKETKGKRMETWFIPSLLETLIFWILPQVQKVAVLLIFKDCRLSPCHFT